VPATPPATLIRARRIAMDHGLRYVYTGNVRHAEGDTTFCPGCHQALIERDWHHIVNYRLTPAGDCPHCGTAVAGRFAARAGSFGRRRIPIAIGA
jgi:pyruvate formate lyase activating enzyme